MDSAFSLFLCAELGKKKSKNESVVMSGGQISWQQKNQKRNVCQVSEENN